MGPAAPRIWLVTDPAFADDAILACVDRAARGLPRGAFGVQLRDKTSRHVASLRELALALRVVTSRHGAWLVVNGRPLLARDIGAEGVHLGREAAAVTEARAAVGRPTWVSVAAHSDAEVLAAVEAGADAVLVSPVFPTRPPSALAAAKKARGLEAIRSARAAIGAGPTGPTLYALGGVTPERVLACAEAGADGVAVLRALLASEHPGQVARAIHDALPRRW
jgi:thiamine-phosphate pyrophosphorylase